MEFKHKLKSFIKSECDNSRSKQSRCLIRTNQWTFVRAAVIGTSPYVSALTKIFVFVVVCSIRPVRFRNIISVKSSQWEANVLDLSDIKILKDYLAISKQGRNPVKLLKQNLKLCLCDLFFSLF